MKPTDEELEAMAERLDRNGPSHVDADIWMSEAAAMLRACKTGDVLLRECAGAVTEIPPMPPTTSRRPYIDTEPEGYLESNRDWAEANDEAVEWLADNHLAIRRALTPPERTKP
jgi:hypothetical protein